MALSMALGSAKTASRARVDRERGCLVGARCTACQTPVWPARAVCHRCGSAAVEAVKFESTGMLVTYTTVHVPRPQLEAPYVLGQVRIDGDGPVVFGHIRGLVGERTVPLRVRLGLAPDPDVTPWYWFEPDGDPDH